jgi:hypothetical protein
MTITFIYRPVLIKFYIFYTLYRKRYVRLQQKFALWSSSDGDL